MTDRKQLLKAAIACEKDDCDGCPYGGQRAADCLETFLRDMQKELQPPHAAEPFSHLDRNDDLYFTCGNCNQELWDEDYRFCPWCGTPIAWKGEA